MCKKIIEENDKQRKKDTDRGGGGRETQNKKIFTDRNNKENEFQDWTKHSYLHANN